MKRRILFVNGNLNIGGVERSLIDILRHFDYDNHNVDLLLLQSGDDLLPDLPPQVNILRRELDSSFGRFFKALYFSIRQRNWLCVWFRILQVLHCFLPSCIYGLLTPLLRLNGKYDVAIAFRPGVCTDIVAYCCRATKKIAWWHHGDLNIGISQKELLASWRNFDKVICVSMGTAKMLGDLSERLAKKIRIIPNIIDIDEIERKSLESIPYIKQQGCAYLVTVGRLAQEKHIENVIKAAVILKKKNIKFKWYVIGGGELLGSLRDLASSCNVDDCICFEGFQSNPYPWIRNADIMVHTSYVESFGIAILEAMSLSVPCIVTDSAGPKEFIDGNNGILVDRNVRNLADAIELLCKDRERQNMISMNAKNTALKYSGTEIIQSIYNEFSC